MTGRFGRSDKITEAAEILTLARGGATATADTTHQPVSLDSSVEDLFSISPLQALSADGDTTQGDLVYSDTDDNWTRLAHPGAGRVLGTNATVPAWLTAGSGVTVSSTLLRADVNGLVENASPATNDWVMVEVNAGGTLRKVQLSNISGTTDHGGLTGLSDDDHTQYFLLAGETTDAQLHSGADLQLFSDAGSTLKGTWAGSTGAIEVVSGAYFGISSSGARFEVQSSGCALDVYSGADFRLFSDAGSTLKGSWSGSSGKMLINETANTAMTVGITINAGANTDEMFSLKGSGIAHGVTNWAETDTFGFLTVDTANAGGLYAIGLTEDTRAIRLSGVGVTDNTARAASAVGYVELRAYKKSGSGITTPGTNANLVVIRSGANSRFAFDQEGEMHSDDVIGVGDDWDDWDDLTLASDLSRMWMAKWDEMMAYQAEDFERAGLMTLYDNGRRAFFKHKAMLKFYACCFREVGQRLARQDQALLALGADPALLEGG